MKTRSLTGRTAIVTGGSRGFGRGIAAALVEAGVNVIGVARTQGPLLEVQKQLEPLFTPVVGNATDPVLAGALIEEHEPDILVLNAGAIPLAAPLQEQTWDTFRASWEIDTQQAFHWSRAALVEPLKAGSVVITMSSGAALRGSPLSGGYAGAKASMRFISSYAAEESARNNLGIRFVSLLPQLSIATSVGLTGATAYARRQGVSLEAFIATMPMSCSVETMGRHLLQVAAAADTYPSGSSYLVSAEALHPLS